MLDIYDDHNSARSLWQVRELVVRERGYNEPGLLPGWRVRRAWCDDFPRGNKGVKAARRRLIISSIHRVLALRVEVWHVAADARPVVLLLPALEAALQGAHRQDDPCSR